MIKYLSIIEILYLHSEIIKATGGSQGIRDIGLLESALAQPKATFEGNDLFPTLDSKAAALGYTLVMNHPFVDGNKRVGHAAIEAFLGKNGFELQPDVGDESLFLKLADGQIDREVFQQIIKDRIKML